MVTNVFELGGVCCPRLNVNGDTDLNRFRRSDQAAAVRLYGAGSQEADLLRVATANDAAEIVAEIDSVLRDREASVPEEAPDAPTVDDILTRMSAYMEVPAAA